MISDEKPRRPVNEHTIREKVLDLLNSASQEGCSGSCVVVDVGCLADLATHCGYVHSLNVPKDNDG